MQKIFVSACLVGENVKYDGKNNQVPEDVIKKLSSKFEIIPFCPEVEGGLGVPREPVELVGGQGAELFSGKARAVGNKGADCTKQFLKGAELAVKKCVEEGCNVAFMRDGSPSCGSKLIYDGTFTSKKIAGKGAAAYLLDKYEVNVYSDNDIDEFEKFLNEV